MDEELSSDNYPGCFVKVPGNCIDEMIILFKHVWVQFSLSIVRLAIVLTWPYVLEISDYKLALISGKSIMEANGWSFDIEYSVFLAKRSIVLELIELI